MFHVYAFDMLFSAGLFTFLFISAVVCYFVLLFDKIRNAISSAFGFTFTIKTVDTPVLFITAHPDDEVMFFAPSILDAVDRKPELVYLLCVTNGGSKRREEELLKSCKKLGLLEANISIIDNSGVLFADNPNAVWDLHKLAGLLLAEIKRRRVKTVVTFDSYGVSGHGNHSSIHTALQPHVTLSSHGDDSVSVNFLESVPLWRKYSSFIDIWLTLWEGYRLRRIICISSPQQVLTTWAAMKLHASQFVWFRKLYIVFSRYVLFNSFTRFYLKKA